MSATRQRDLRTGRSVWQARRLQPLPAERMGRAAAVDVLVVGAGISGAMIADALSDAGCEVLVVDRRRPFTGSTTASTSLILYELDTPMLHLARRIGRHRTERMWQRSKLALDALRERIEALDIAADHHDIRALYLAGDVLGPAALGREALLRRQAGFDVTLLSPPEVEGRYGIVGRSALVTHSSLIADPRRLAQGFLRAAAARGSRLAWPVQIDEVAASRGRLRARTSSGAVITARHVVFATGYELARGVPGAGHHITSTWAMATRPQRQWSWTTDRFVVWEASSPYLYVRPGPEGRLICGGEDAPFSDTKARDALIPRKTSVLQRKLAALLPGVDVTPDYAWCGSFGSSSTGTPSIGPVPGMPGCIAVLGYGGNGITFSMLAAQLVRSCVLGQRDADAALFSFRRGW
jgi:glycine/D-amino acid oxidase-like deaminating enzyme